MPATFASIAKAIAERSLRVDRPDDIRRPEDGPSSALMRRRQQKFFRTAAAAGLFASALLGGKVQAAGAGMDLSCKPPAANSVGEVPESRQVAESIVCRYRLHEPASIDKAVATLNTRPVSAQISPVVSGGTPTSTVLFAIDASSAGEKRLQHLHTLVDTGAPGHRFGLAFFGGELEVAAPFGSNVARIKQAAGAFETSERPTELYRNALEATRLLARESTERKALFLFSDGLAEDRAYFHKDVVDAARAAGVVIYGIGYPRSVEESVALQSLRRLADETGGHFVAADVAGELPAAFFDTPYDVLDNVGEVFIPRPVEGWPAGANPKRLSLALATAAGEASATAELDFPPVAGAKSGSTGAGATLEKLTGAGSERTLLYGLIGAGFLAVLLGASAMWLRSRRTPAPAAADTKTPGATQNERPPADEEATGLDSGPAASGDEGAGRPASTGSRRRRRKDDLQQPLQQSESRPSRGKSHREHPAVAVAVATGAAGVTQLPIATAGEPVPVEESAFLERMGEDGDAYPILSSPISIGRQSDNDVVLKDPSISRHHAVVERRGPGEYVVRDLGALNGVIVNGARKPETTLSDGDLIELGDLALKFGLEVDEDSPVAAANQETLILNGGFGAGSKTGGLSLASFGDLGDLQDSEDGLDFLNDDEDELKSG
ncbi:MAG: FHA domain-containing protein [Gammaproteobacteria bacterium]